MKTITQAALESRCMGSGNSGQRRAGDQGGKELQNIEARYRLRVTKRHIAGVI